MTTDFRALCVDLLEEIKSMVVQSRWGEVHRNDDLINRVIGALKEPIPAEPELPTDQELRDWHAECADLTLLGEVAHHWASDMRHEEVAAIARAALAKWGKFAPHLPTAKESLVDPVEEAYKRVFGEYPPTDPSVHNFDDNQWFAFQKGYNCGYGDSFKNKIKGKLR